MATVKIKDDFDLKKIINSGQCFRAAEIEDNLFRFVTKKYVVYIKQLDEENFDVSCTQHEWEDTWVNYFDLETNYSDIRQAVGHFAERTPFEEYLKAAAEFSKGIRILRQEPLETLISFIISQRKTIPAIKKSVELVCETFGRDYKTERGETLKLFPTIEQLSKATQMQLSTCALGYRGAYVHDAISKVQERIVRLDGFRKTPDEDMLLELQQIKGVGIKVACCVALYAYHRLNIAPFDVWIKRAIDEDFKGRNIFAEFARYAGVLQQYIFYYKRLADKKDFELGD